MGRPEGSYFIDSDVLGLRNYKYHSIDQSIIANYILNPYWWSQVIKLFPLWVAPNLITLIGFLSVVVHLVALLFFSPALETPCPDWVYLSCAIAFFFYQTMDAIDGKQARRTGTSGPLGELFDHGCDALNCGLLSILGLHTFCVPQSPFFIFSTFCTLSSFYLNTWEEYHTGTLFLSVLSGPIEGLFATIAFFLIRYAYGPDVFTMSLRKGFPDWAVQYVGGRDAVPDVPFFVIMFGIGIIVVIFNAIGSTYNVVVAARARGKSVLAPFAGVLPLLLTISGAILWLSVSPTIVTTHLVPFSLLMTLLLGYHVGLIILAHVAKRPFPYFSFPSSVVLLGIAVAASL
ncbi:CDP-alcohol phosphatidyltransferase, partial [Zopfochytrium polystomum]